MYHVFFLIPESIAVAAAVISNGAKTFFAKEIASFINGPANLLNNDPKNPPDWIILEVCALESFKSVDILLLKAFQNFVFCLVVNNDSGGISFILNTLKLILKVPVLFLTAVFSFFSWVPDNLTFTLLYLTIYTNYRTFAVPFGNSSIVSFGFSRIFYSFIFVPAAPSTTP